MELSGGEVKVPVSQAGAHSWTAKVLCMFKPGQQLSTSALPDEDEMLLMFCSSK